MKLVDNKESCLEVLDLSNNPLEDKGLLHLSGALPLIKHGGLRRLDFSRAGTICNFNFSVRCKQRFLNRSEMLDLICVCNQNLWLSRLMVNRVDSSCYGFTAVTYLCRVTPCPHSSERFGVPPPKFGIKFKWLVTL